MVWGNVRSLCAQTPYSLEEVREVCVRVDGKDEGRVGEGQG